MRKQCRLGAVCGAVVSPRDLERARRIAATILAEIEEPEKLAVLIEERQHKVGLSCSFCGAAQNERKQFIAGPTVYICDVCVGMSADIIRECDEAT